MPDKKYIYKEEFANKSKAFKLFILIVGELVFAVLLFLIIQLFKTDAEGINRFLSYFVGTLFSVFLVAMAVLTWGYFHSHYETRITKKGIVKSYKLPPFTFQKGRILKKNIKTISTKNSDLTIFKNDVFLINESDIDKSDFQQIILKTKNGKEELFETDKPHDFIEAIKKMFSERRF